jgi:hypothetical protein
MTWVYHVESGVVKVIRFGNSIRCRTVSSQAGGDDVARLAGAVTIEFVATRLLGRLAK